MNIFIPWKCFLLYKNLVKKVTSNSELQDLFSNQKN